jgi:hypothetical protein
LTVSIARLEAKLGKVLRSKGGSTGSWLITAPLLEKNQIDLTDQDKHKLTELSDLSFKVLLPAFTPFRTSPLQLVYKLIMFFVKRVLYPFALQAKTTL